jgi:glycine cleavage system transcriptional repressor
VEYEHCRTGFSHPVSGDDDSAQLFIQITAHSPATQNASNIEQAFKALCTELNAQGSINIVNYSQHDEQDGV